MKCKCMSIGPQLHLIHYVLPIKTILVTVFLLYKLHVRRIREFGYLRLYTQVFSARNPMLKQCRILLLLDRHLNILLKNPLISFTKHISTHMLSTVSRPGAHAICKVYLSIGEAGYNTMQAIKLVPQLASQVNLLTVHTKP